MDTLHFLSGERFDIVVSATQEPRDYWIRIRELHPCWKNIEGFAILRYRNAHETEGRESIAFSDRQIPTFYDSYPTTRIFNSPEVGQIALTDAKAYESDESLINMDPDQQFDLVFDSPPIRNTIMFSRRNLNEFNCEKFLF